MLIDFFKNRVSKNFFLNGFDIKFKKTELSKTKVLIILIMTTQRVLQTFILNDRRLQMIG